MSHQIIKQPNGLYALFSSIVDDFVMIDATPQDIIDYYVEREKQDITNRVNDVVAQLERGEKPYHQFTKSFKQAVREIEQQHGKNTKSLKMLRGEE